MPLKLGKRPAQHDPRTLKLSRYITAAFPPVPNSVKWSSKVPNWPMYHNDEIGDCAIAGPAHQIQAWTFNDNDSPDFTPTDEQVIGEYSRVGHYDPGAASPGMPNPTDGGCVLLEVMKAWRSPGLFGHRIGAFASVTPADHHAVCVGIYLFGGLCVGLSLPVAVQDMEIWRSPSKAHLRNEWAPGSWGGHCVELVDYDEQFVTAVTWGGLKQISWTFLENFCDEAYASISADWLGADFKAPHGMDLNTLLADLSALH